MGGVNFSLAFSMVVIWGAGYRNGDDIVCILKVGNNRHIEGKDKAVYFTPPGRLFLVWANVLSQQRRL